jgi:hypothetical protein
VTVRTEPPPRRGSRLAITALALAVLLLSGAVAAFLTGALPLGRQAAGATTPSVSTTGGPPTTGDQTTPAATTTVTGSPSAPATENPDALVPAGWRLLVSDSLAAPGRWHESMQTPSGSPAAASCVLDGRLRVELLSRPLGVYKCNGVRDQMTDFSVRVNATLENANSCAAIWFRYTTENGGYALTVCRDRMQVWSHTGTALTLLESQYLQTNVPIGRTTQVGIRTDGERLMLYLNGEKQFEVHDLTYTSGRVALGVMPHPSTAPSPFRVSFTDIAIYKPL